MIDSGFFTSKETQSKAITSARSSCFVCGLHRNSTPLNPVGNFAKRIMIIGGFPDKRESNNAQPWLGRDGKLLKKILREIKIDLWEDCISLHAVNCVPNNDKPTGKEIYYCRDVKVVKAIEKYNPRVIILLGMTAVTSVVGDKWKSNLGSIFKWRGWTIPDQEFKAWVCPTFNPAYVSKMELSEVNIIWKQDLQRAISLGDLPEYKEPNIHYIEDLSVLDSIKSGMVAFDYETTGIKPYFIGHRVVCASVAYDQDNVYAFIMPSKKSLRRPFISFLQNRKIKKVASNMKYEDHWSFIRLKSEVKGWFHDTMLTAHVLDNRPGISGLKFQAYVNMGVVGYGEEVNEFITRSKEKGNRSNAINMIFDLLKKRGGEKELLKYCALDSIYEYRLAEIQMKKLKI